MIEARDRGQLVRGEADYQLHLIYLWYEKRPRDALAIVRGPAARYPRNPLFYQLEAEILDVYFHDAAASLAASSRCWRAPRRGGARARALASVRARLNMAQQLDRLGERAEAIDAAHRARSLSIPSRPFGAIARAAALPQLDCMHVVVAAIA